MTVYVVESEDRLDHVVKAVLGTLADGAIEAVLDANPGLAAVGLFLPAGTQIVVPDFTVPAATVVNPWD